MAVTILALLLLRTGIRRGRARQKEIKALQASSDNVPSSSATPAEGSTATTTSKSSDTSDSVTTETTSKQKPSGEGESSTTAAERQAMLDEADALTRDEPQK
jgi:hypothetical protein